MTVCPWCGAENPERFTFCGASSVDIEVLREVLADYWRRARSVVERFGGTVETFIGDAVVGMTIALAILPGLPARASRTGRRRPT